LLVEGLPGSGKSTTAYGLARWLAGRGTAAEYWPEGRTDHPADLEQVALLTDAERAGLGASHPGWASLLDRVVEPTDGGWLVRHPQHPDLPADLVDALRAYDAYDGPVRPELHARALLESWRRFGATPAPAAVQVWECVLLQNPVCAFVARFDRPTGELRRHVAGLVQAVAGLGPALVYLDPGDPAPVLARAVAERPADWARFAIGYHTEQGYGLARGLHGFDGYVEFMRHRRELELALLDDLTLPTLVVDTGRTSREESTASIREFALAHVR